MAKRGNGEGTIKQRADGRWEARLSLPTGARRSVYGRTRRAVQTKLQEATAARAQGLPVAPKRQTVGQYLDHWLEEVVRAKVRPRTYETYSTYVRHHLSPGLGRLPLVALSPQDVQAWLRQEAAAGLSPRTVSHMRSVLRGALAQALRWGLVARNAAALAEAPYVPRVEIRPLSDQEARRLQEALRGDRLEALYLLSMALGLRQGEVLGLRWENIDWDRGTLSVRFALQRIDGRYELVEPKTARSRRTLPLPTFVQSALLAHQLRQGLEAHRAGEHWQQMGLVFTTATGGPLNAAVVTHHFNALEAAAGIPRRRFHDLRHTAATLLLQQGVSPRQIMELLGHSQISLTMNTYAHVLEPLMRDAADKMDALFSPPPVVEPVPQRQEPALRASARER